MGKRRLPALLTEALAVEEVEVMHHLNLFLRKLRASRLDEEVDRRTLAVLTTFTDMKVEV